MKNNEKKKLFLINSKTKLGIVMNTLFPFIPWSLVRPDYLTLIHPVIIFIYVILYNTCLTNSIHIYIYQFGLNWALHCHLSLFFLY